MSDHIIFSCILISIFCVFLMVKNYRKWEKKTEQRLNRLAEQIAGDNGLLLSNRDYFQEKALGFDMLNNKILFVDLEGNSAMVLNMDEIGNCTLIKKQLSIQLELIYQDPDKAPLTITFYNKFKDRTWRRPKLEKKAVYWEALMNETLDKKLESVPSSDAKDFE